jgi:hypothetical protein
MRRSLTLRRSLAALALPLILGGLAACGSDDEGADPAASSSSSATESQDSSETDAGGDVDPADFVDDLKSGLEESTTAQMTMQMDMGGQGISADGEVDYSTTPPQMAMSMESPAAAGQSIEMRLVDGVIYMNMGQMTNNKFVSFDLSDPSNLPPGMDQLANTMDPLGTAMDGFEKGVQSVVFVGDEDVDGEQLGHYEVTVDTSKIEQLQQQPTQAQMPKEVVYDMWLDDQNRMRKLAMNLEVQGAQTETEIELSNWGEPVDIAAPPASEIAKQPQM